MPFIPNNADAYNLGLASGERFQAVPDATDFDIIAAGTSLAGAVSAGCAVTAQATPNNTVAVAAGVVIVNGVNIAVAAVAALAMTAAHATNNRRDIVAVNNAGTVSYIAGTAVASTLVPVKPAIPANSVVLAEILVPAAATTIGATQIVDKRQISQVGGRVLAEATVVTTLAGLNATSPADVAGLTVSPVVGGRPVIVRAELPFINKITAVGNVTFRIIEGATTLQVAVVSFNGFGSGSGVAWDNAVLETPSLTPSVGAHTYNVQYSSNVAGIDLYGDPSFPNVIRVIEV